MEWLLHKSIQDQSDTILIDDTDQIHSYQALTLLMCFYEKCNNEQRPRILQDLLLIVKWNPQNVRVLLNYSEFYFWLLDITLEKQIEFFENQSHQNQ